MTFEEFTRKLAAIQANGHLSIEDTMQYKRYIVGVKKLWECSEEELDEIVEKYRKEYRKANYSQSAVNYKSKYVKSKHKYSARRDWD